MNTNGEYKISPEGQQKLFVGQVPKTFPEEELRKIFENYGTVLDIAHIKDKITGLHSGCCFVTMADKESADNAIESLNGTTKLPNAKRELVVRYAGVNVPPDEWKLYIGMLDRNTTEDEVRRMFEPYGVLKEVYLMRQKETGHSKGSAFVKYSHRDEAVRAINALHDRIRDKSAPGNIQVRFARTRMEKLQQQHHPISHSYGYGNMMPQRYPSQGYQQQGMYPQQQVMSVPLHMHNMPMQQQPMQQMQQGPIQQQQQQWNQQYMQQGLPMQKMGNYSALPSQSQSNSARGPPGANLFVYNIPEGYSDIDLQQLFASFGSILSAKVFRDKHTGVSKGYGFVSFDNTTSATQAIASMDGMLVGNRKLTVRHKKGSSEFTQQAPIAPPPSTSYYSSY